MAIIGNDAKLETCLSFIFEKLEEHRRDQFWKEDKGPLLVGINGVQGCGKTTLVSPSKRRTYWYVLTAE